MAVDQTQLEPAVPPPALAPERRARSSARRPVRMVAEMCALAVAYYVAGRASLALQYDGPVAAVWLPTGIAAATLYLAGLRWLPAVVVGDLALTDPAHPIGTALGITAGNIADILAIALLLRILLGPRAGMDRLQSVGGVLVAIAAGALTTATVATLSLRAGDVIAASDVPGFWRSWLLADAAGSLVVVPLALAWAAPRPPAWRSRAAWEGPLLLATVVALSAIALSSDLPLTYLVFPALTWAALRFGPRGATLAVAVAALTTVAMSAEEVGAFVTQTFSEAALMTQLYIAVAAVTTLCLAAIVSERQRGALELAESRGRVIVAAAEERRRVESELHDSVQNRLVALGIRMRLAEERTYERMPEAADVFPPLLDEIDSVIDELRRIAHGIFPPLLRSNGLVAALRAELRHSMIPVDVSEEDVGRGRPDVELALYLCCLEAIQNAAKHAGEHSSVTVRLRREDGGLAFSIRDAGRGFDVRATKPGTGLTNVRGRIDAVGGHVEITAAPGRGTIVSGVVPWSSPGAAPHP